MAELRTMACPVCDGPVEAETDYDLVGTPVTCATCRTCYVLAYDIEWDAETAAETGCYRLRLDR